MGWRGAYSDIDHEDPGGVALAARGHARRRVLSHPQRSAMVRALAARQVAAERKAVIDEWSDAEVARHESNRVFFESLLVKYVVRPHAADGTKAINLPSGVLKARRTPRRSRSMSPRSWPGRPRSASATGCAPRSNRTRRRSRRRRSTMARRCLTSRSTPAGTEPPWDPWRLHVLEARMQSCLRNSRRGSRRLGGTGTAVRRKIRRCVWSASCGRSWGPITGRCSGSRDSGND